MSAKKLMVACLFLAFILSSCSAESDYYTNLSEELRQEEFIDEVLEDNQRLRDESSRARERIDDLNSTIRDLERENSVLRGRIDVLRERLLPPPGPQGNLDRDDVEMFLNRAVISVQDPFLAVFKDTKSMEPVLNKDSMAIQVPPDAVDVREGDIISFRSERRESLVVHRVISSGTDSEGWFAMTKGDNNERPDEGKVREDDIIGVTVAILY